MVVLFTLLGEHHLNLWEIDEIFSALNGCFFEGNSKLVFVSCRTFQTKQQYIGRGWSDATSALISLPFLEISGRGLLVYILTVVFA